MTSLNFVNDVLKGNTIKLTNDPNIKTLEAIFQECSMFL